MMLYSAPDPAPNPRRVKLFLRDKGLELPITDLSLMQGEHRSPETLARNARGQVPFLELDDGRVIAETVAICRYLDELHPEPPMFGINAFERAETDMWIRRVETGLGAAVSGFWIHGHKYTSRLIKQIPEYAELSKTRVDETMHWIDTQLQGRTWLAGGRYSMADIVLLSMVDFGGWIGLPIPEDAKALRNWHERATARYA